MQPDIPASRHGLIERHSIDYVPLAERHGKVWHLWPVWFSGSAHLATLAAGVVGISLGGNFIWSAIAVIGGVALGTFFMAFHSAQGPQLGLPQMIQSRPQFGYRGALLVWVVALIAYIGYNAFNQVLAAQAFHQLERSAAPTSPVTIVVFTVLSVSLAALGYDLIHLAQRWIAYLMMAMLSVFTIVVLAHGGMPAGAFDLGAFQTVPFLAQFFAAAAYQLSWSIYVSDYSRYLPKDVSVSSTFWWTCAGAFLGGSWMMLVGTASAALSPGQNVAAAMQSAADRALPGFGTPLVFASMFGLLTITSLNFYGASLTLLGMVDSFKKLSCTISQRLGSLAVVAVAACAIALLASHDFINSFEILLSVLLYLFTPWTAINLVDFYVVRKGHYSVREIFNPNGMYGRWNWRGLVSYGIGFISMLPFFATDVPYFSREFHVGYVARLLGGADIAMLVGLPVSAACYLLACRSLDRDSDQQRALEADAGLDA